MRRYDALAPDTWMDGWNGRYQNEAELSDNDLVDFLPHYTVQQLFDFAPFDNEKFERVLEVGCGSGKSALYMAKQGLNVTAIDAIPLGIEVAQRRARLLRLDDRVDFSIMNMIDHKIARESYDIIVAIQCLQYLFDMALVKLDEILAGVKPGGFFVYSGNILPHFPTDPPIRFITKDELLQRLEGWELYSLGTEERSIRSIDDIRGFIRVIARKPFQ